MRLAIINHELEVRHDGRLYRISIPALELPVCQKCGEKVFTNSAHNQITEALRCHLGLMRPTEIQKGIERIGMTPKEVADCLGIAEESLSLWLNAVQVQSLAMDRLLRTFFAFPAVRAALSKSQVLADLGSEDVPELQSRQAQ